MITDILQEILDWSEVWAPIIPLVIVSLKRKTSQYLIPAIIYLWLALIISAFADAGWKFQVSVEKVAHTYCNNCYSVEGLKDKYLPATPGWMHPNNYLYNIHSIVRFICFGIFFFLIGQSFRSVIDKIVLALAVLYILINFLFLEKFYNPVTISSRLFAIESGLLLYCCLRYYLNQLKLPFGSDKKNSLFWIVTGLSIYVVFNFFFFLFYTALVKDYGDFLAFMWNFHNITFIILCIFIARAFYVSDHK